MNLTPIFYAIWNNSKDIVELLISKGATINTIDMIYQIIKILFLIKIF